jgi:hypothetical protein
MELPFSLCGSWNILCVLHTNVLYCRFFICLCIDCYSYFKFYGFLTTSDTDILPWLCEFCVLYTLTSSECKRKFSYWFRREIEQAPPFNVGVKKEWSLTSKLPYDLVAGPETALLLYNMLIIKIHNTRINFLNLVKYSFSNGSLLLRTAEIVISVCWLHLYWN